MAGRGGEGGENKWQSHREGRAMERYSADFRTNY